MHYYKGAREHRPPLGPQEIFTYIMYYNLININGQKYAVVNYELLIDPLPPGGKFRSL